MPVDESSSGIAERATVIAAPPDVSSVDHLLGSSESDSGAVGETTGDEEQRLETNDLTQSQPKKRKQQQHPRNPASERASRPTSLAECLAHTQYNSGLDLIALQAARDDAAERTITSSDSSPRLQQAKEAARARLAEYVDDENGWTKLLIEEVTPGNDPNEPCPSCTIGKLASLQQYFDKLSISNTACLQEKDERISSLDLQLQEVRKRLGNSVRPMRSKQAHINELTRANQKLAKDLESKQLDLDNRIRDVETTRRELEAANTLLETRQ